MNKGNRNKKILLVFLIGILPVSIITAAVVIYVVTTSVDEYKRYHSVFESAIKAEYGVLLNEGVFKQTESEWYERRFDGRLDGRAIFLTLFIGDKNDLYTSARTSFEVPFIHSLPISRTKLKAGSEGDLQFDGGIPNFSPETLAEITSFLVDNGGHITLRPTVLIWTGNGLSFSGEGEAMLRRFVGLSVRVRDDYVGE